MYPIVYSTDEKYLPFVSVSIQSIIANNDTNEHFKIFIFYDEISELQQKKVLSMQTPNIEIAFIDVKKHLNFDLNLLKTCFHYTKEMYYRFLIPYLFEEFEKILYVDCDLIFNINPKIYFDINIGKNCLGAINDVGILNTKLKYHEYVKSLGVVPEKYFNSGVLVMNIKELIKIKLYEKFVEKIKEERTYLFPDQDLLNIICKDKICYLDYAYNFQWVVYLDKPPIENFSNEMLYQNYMASATSPYIVHFAAGKKPWKNPELPMSEYFWKYARLSPYYEEILTNSIIQKTSQMEKFNLFDYYKYKIKSKIPNKKQAHYKQKYKQVKTILQQRGII